MAISITYTMTRLCSGGGHANVRAAIDGDAGRTFRDLDTDLLRTNLSADEREQFAQLCIRVKLMGMSRAQARNTLEAGFTVTI
jgi:hypothetical protein